MASAVKVPENALPSNTSDGASIESESVSNKGKNWKGKKRKNKLRDHTAPRQPLTGYVRFLNQRREVVRAENPHLSFPEIIKILAQEWSQLPAEEKRPYQEAGEQDRERYMQELSAYKQTEAYKNFSQLQQQQQQEAQSKKQKVNQESKKPKSVIETNEESKQSEFGGFDIPIFTEEFLDHNKAREAELRQLRKSSTDYESQNASLGRIVESLRTAVSTLEADTVTQRANNATLNRHLNQLRSSLITAFQGVALPDFNEKPTMENIDSFMNRLHSVLLSPNGTRDNPQLFARVSSIVERLNVPG